ncbi:substrate-binding domain-containing protein [Candidatus Poribacteria bacterium]|nr:substrate-binding domain-containing protein [Candidatus Poribacteria bacterium]
MKKYILVFSWLLINLFVFKQISFAAESDVDKLLDLLIEKNVVTKDDASGLRADLALKKQEEKESQKEFVVIAGNPVKISGYTQVRFLQDKTSTETFDIRRVRLDIKGDITERFDYRTQIEFGGSYKYKSVVLAPIKNGKYNSTDIAVSGGPLLLDAIAGLVDIGMVSRDPDPAEIKKGILPVYILHDAVFPVISDKNPVLSDLLKSGIKRKTWIDIYITGLITTWDEVATHKVNKKLHVYTRSDACGAAASWAVYLGKKQEDLKGIGIYGDPGLLEAAKRDPIGIGYNNFSYIFTRDGSIVKGAKIVPIDSNENGTADADEVYQTRDEAIKGIRSGRYPATRKNYFFVKGKSNKLVKEFIEFTLSDEGTKIVDEVGTSLSLTKTEREKILNELK